MSVDELQKLTPAIDWNKFISEMGITKTITRVNVRELKYMKAIVNF